MSSTIPKTPPAGPLREPLPPVYPISLIEAACRALEVLGVDREFKDSLLNGLADEASGCALRIICDGLLSHERAAQEGRSRG